ncbi:TPA: phage tail tape measure protein [Yersinia enterocolitica]|nr:phage tail tape measure protein [Yersinia enterocolitica]
MDVDTATFNEKLSRVSNGLNEVVKKGESDAERIKRLVQEGVSRAQNIARTSAEAVKQQAFAADTLNNKMVSVQAMVAQAHQQIAQYSERLKEETQQAAAISAAQDRVTQTFFRQIESVKELGTGMQKLTDIQVQLRQARAAGNISQGDYLTLLSATCARVKELTQAEQQAQVAKVQFIRHLKAQLSQQKLTQAEMLRYKAAQLGVADAADVYIRKIENATKATHSLGLKSAATRRELGVLLGELARGNLGALRGSGITLANRAGWIDQLMSLRGLATGGLIGGIAAAVYGLGKAWYEGQKEGEEFNRQLALTGHYAGVTAGQLWTLSRVLSGNGITQHAAASALAQVVSSGAFRGNDIGMVAKAAAQMERSVGQSVSDTINQFKRLKDDPVNAAKALDNELHFLTATQLEQIRVLGEQGRSSDAARIAMSALAEETGRRTADIDNNLNALGSTLKYLSDLWNRFWDAAMNIGREDSLDEQIATLQEKVARAKRLPWAASSSQVEYDQQRLNDLQEKKRQKDLQDAKEQAERNYQEQQKRRNAENAALNRMNETEAARHQHEIARIRSMEYADATVRDAALEREEKRYQQALAQSRNKPKSYHDDEATRLLLQYAQKQRQLQAEIDTARSNSNQKLTESEKALLALRQRMALISSKQLSDADKSVLAHQKELELALQQNAAKEHELQQQNALNELKKKGGQLSQQLAEEEANARQQHELALKTTGMGDKVRQRYQEELAIRQHYQALFAQLERDSEAKGTKGSTEYQKVTGEIEASLARRLADLKNYREQEDALTRDWSVGASRAFQNFTAEADNAAGTTDRLFNASFDHMGKGIEQFCLTGKLNFRSFTSSLLADLAKIMAQMASMQMVKGIGSLFGFTLNALGGVYDSVSLSKYSGTIVDRPTFFAFAKGAGVMGEAGPEAILPLRRGRDGKLGVVAAGQGRVIFAPQYHIEINNDGSNGQIGPQALQAVYSVGKKAAADFMQQQQRDGGQMSGGWR